MNRKHTSSLQSLAFPQKSPIKTNPDAIDEMDHNQNFDQKSEAAKTVIITDPLREKLLTGTYTTDDAFEILENL